jgi:hypothetical protein
MRKNNAVYSRKLIFNRYFILKDQNKPSAELIKKTFPGNPNRSKILRGNSFKL